MGTGASVSVDGIRSRLEADVGASDVELSDEQVAELQAMCVDAVMHACCPTRSGRFGAEGHLQASQRSGT